MTSTFKTSWPKKEMAEKVNVKNSKNPSTKIDNNKKEDLIIKK